MNMKKKYKTPKCVEIKNVPLLLNNSIEDPNGETGAWAKGSTWEEEEDEGLGW